MNEGTAENTATKPQLTRGQLETISDCLEALGIQPTHWGNTVFEAGGLIVEGNRAMDEASKRLP
jgi:hypothetical protein